MLDRKHTEKLLEIDSFKRAVHELMNMYHMSDYEAQQVLYSYVVEKRLKNWDIQDIYKAIDDLDEELNTKLKWIITYSRRSIAEINNREYAKQKMNDDISVHLDIIQLDDIDKISEKDLDRILTLIPSLFADSSTALWVQSVLEKGKLSTQDSFSQSNKQFRDKLRSVEKYCENHREKFVNIVMSKEQRELIEEEKVLNEFIDLVENENSNDNNFQDLIQLHYDYIDDLIGLIPMVHKPLQLINNFKNAELKDKYKLVNKINERYSYLKNKLIEE